MTIESPKAQKRRAIRTVLHAAQHLIPSKSKAAVLSLPDFLAYVLLIQAAHKLGYKGPLLNIEKVKL